MSNEKPAPRLCTLWGSTFDANDVYAIHHSEMAGQVYIHLFSNLGQSFIDFQGLAHSYFGEREARMTGYHEAITAIHNALHPPLCLKSFLKHYDALNQAHTPKKESLGKIYVVTDDNTMAPIMLFSHQLNSYYLAKSLFESGYKKVTILNLDGTFYPYGEAEALVNAYKEPPTG